MIWRGDGYYSMSYTFLVRQMWLRRKTIPDTIPKLRLRTYASMTTTMTDGCARRNTTWLRPVVYLIKYNTKTIQHINTYYNNLKQLRVASFVTFTLNAYFVTTSFLIAILISRESATLFYVRGISVYPKQNLTRRYTPYLQQ